MSHVGQELKKLLDTYYAHQEELNQQFLVAKKHDDWNGIHINMMLQHQAMLMTKALKHTIIRISEQNQ